MKFQIPTSQINEYRRQVNELLQCSDEASYEALVQKYTAQWSSPFASYFEKHLKKVNSHSNCICVYHTVGSYMLSRNSLLKPQILATKFLLILFFIPSGNSWAELCICFTEDGIPKFPPWDYYKCLRVVQWRIKSCGGTKGK